MYSTTSIKDERTEELICTNSSSNPPNKPIVAEVFLEDPFYNRQEAAIYISRPSKRSYSPGTLAVWDCTKKYDLQPVKINGEICYRKSSLDRFLRERLKP